MSDPLNREPEDIGPEGIEDDPECECERDAWGNHTIDCPLFIEPEHEL